VDSDTLAALARAGGVSVDWLLGLEEPEGPVAGSIEDALDAAFVTGRHALRDAEAVRSIARGMAFSLEDDLIEAARAWLESAVNALRLQIEADIQSLGVPATRATELGRGLAEKLRRLRSREE